MIFKSYPIFSLIFKRNIITTPTVAFKFKLTEEMTREFEDSELAKNKKEPPPQALHTKEGSLIMGRVSSERFRKVVKVGIPKHRLNNHLLMFFREIDDIYAYDEDDSCKPGDWILLRRQKEPLDKDVMHTVERVVYSYGNYVDPITGRRSLGLYYDDDFEKLEKIKLEL